MNTDILIIYESFYNGNTQRLAKAMSNQINCKLANIDEAKELDLKKYKAIGFGSGIVFGKHAPRLMNFISELDNTTQNAFIFSTRGGPFLGSYHKAFKELLVKKGRKVIGEFSAKGYDCTGPFTLVGGGNKGKPNEKDQRKAAQFIENLFPEYKRTDYYLSLSNTQNVRENHTNTYTVKDNGQDIVLQGDLVTVQQNICIGCGQCVQKCPLELFRLKDGKSVPTKELDCIQCSLCQSYCPQKAIYLHGTWKDAIRVAKRHAHR